MVRAEVPKLKLDDVFERKDDIVNVIKSELAEAMRSYGYDIIKALVTDIDPAEEVKVAMNRINAAEREKVAAEYESEADSKRLQGQGIADQRREIAKGLEESVSQLNKVGINQHEASSLIVITQHYDTLHSIGANNKSNLVLLPNSPAAANDMLNSMVAALSATKSMEETK